MANEVEIYRENSLALCNRLLSELEENRIESTRFFGEEIQRAYASATDRAIVETRNVRNRIRNL